MQMHVWSQAGQGMHERLHQPRASPPPAARAPPPPPPSGPAAERLRLIASLLFASCPLPPRPCHGSSSTADVAWVAARRWKCPDAPTTRCTGVQKREGKGAHEGLLTSPGNVVPGVKTKECNETCGALENKEEGNESNCAGCCGLQHAGSNPAVALHGANTLPEMKNSGSGTPQNRTLRIRRTRTVPEITWGMIKKLMKEAEELLQRTSFPLTPDNLFLAMTALIHLSSCSSIESELNSEQAL